MKRARGVTFAVLAIVLWVGVGSRTRVDAQETGAAGASKSLDEAAILGPPQGPPSSGVELDERTRALGERMRCPVCQGLSIAASPSASAMAMVSQVRDLLARGYSEEQVLDYFVRSYGEFVLLEPTAEGFNLTVWLLPVGAVLVGAVLIAMRLRQSRARGDEAKEAGGANAGGGGASRQSDVEDPELARYVERVRSEIGS